MAAGYGYQSMVEVLANAGANLDLRNRVSDYCRTNLPAIVRIIEDRLYAAPVLK